MTKITITQIDLHRVTGYTHTLTEKTLTIDDCGSANEIWKQANELLRAWSWSVTSGSDSVEYDLYYADGMMYKGEIQIRHPKQGKNDSLETTLRTHCLLMSGRKRPFYIPEDAFLQLQKITSAETKARLSHILDTYQIGPEE
jgi:hypothetical protein